MTTITDCSADKLVLPLVAPFAVAARVAYEAKNVLFRIRTDDGLTGLGSAAPVEYVTGESVQTVMATLEEASKALADVPISRLRPLLELAQEVAPSQPTARTAIESALFDLWGKRWGIPLWEFFGGACTSVEADLTIPIVEPERASELAATAVADGFCSLKIKVGDANGPDADMARLMAVCQAAPAVSLRIDANQAFQPDAAVRFIRRVADLCTNVDLIEQPVRKEDIDGLEYVHNRIDLPLFADESAQTVESVVKLIGRKAVDGINIKLMKSGIAGAWQIASLCHAHGVKLMVGCMLESRLSLTAACALVAGTGWFDYVDLDSHHLIKPTSLFKGGFSDLGPILKPEMALPGFGVLLDDAEWNKYADCSSD